MPAKILCLHLSDEAQWCFNTWYSSLNKHTCSEIESPAINSHLGKYNSLIPSLALIIHLAERGKGPISKSCLIKSIKWGVFLESHARRIYASAHTLKFHTAQALAKRIVNGDLSTEFTVRDVCRHNWAGLSKKDEVEKPLNLLVRSKWLRSENIESGESGGRPSTKYIVNPKVFDLNSDFLEKIDINSDQNKFVSFLGDFFDKTDKTDTDNDCKGEVGGFVESREGYPVSEIEKYNKKQQNKDTFNKLTKPSSIQTDEVPPSTADKTDKTSGGWEV